MSCARVATCGPSRWPPTRGWRDDVASVLQWPDCDDITDCKINLMAVCVSACPVAGDVVADDGARQIVRLQRVRGDRGRADPGAGFRGARDVHQSWHGARRRDELPSAVSHPEPGRRAAFWSGVGTPGAFHAAVGARAECAVDSGVAAPARPIHHCAAGLHILAHRDMETTEVTTGGGDVLMKMLVSYIYMLHRMFENVMQTKWFILFCGAVVSLVLGVTFLVLMQLFAPCLVWLIVIGIFLLLTVGDAYMVLKSGTFFGIDVSNVTAVVRSTAEEIAAESEVAGPENIDAFADAGEQEEYLILWTVGAHVAFVLWAVYFVGIFALREKIALCVTIISNSSQYIFRVPGILFLPLFTYTFQLLTMTFFAFFIVIIRICGSFTVADLGEAAQEMGSDCGCEATNLECHHVCVADAVSGSTTGVVAVGDPAAAAHAASQDDLIFYMLWVARFGFFWVTNVFQAIGTITMARSIADN